MPIPKTTVQGLADAVTVLTSVVQSLKETIEAKKEQETEKVREIRTIEQMYPVPGEYFDLVTSILNKDFEIQVNPLSDSPAFQFTVVVPYKYSQISDAYRQMYGADLRPKVISYTDGAQGVRDWLMKVYNSFNPTIQAQIVADRT